MVLFAPVALGVSRVVIAIVLVAIGVLVGVSMLLSPITARNIYDGWQRAAEPIGASVSLAVLSVAYYLVLFPVAVLKRLLTRDPLQREFDRQASSYWMPHNPGADPDRYFKQF